MWNDVTPQFDAQDASFIESQWDEAVTSVGRIVYQPIGWDFLVYRSAATWPQTGPGCDAELAREAGKTTIEGLDARW
jgi:hypothetical protein